tara:strand:- start:3001 stop:3204 length:204 start_codon:yes stop_codon:yes gene_type:complete
MTKEEIIDKLTHLKELMNEIGTTTETLTEEVDNMIHDINGKDDDLLHDPFEVDDQLDDLLNENNFGF